MAEKTVPEIKKDNATTLETTRTREQFYPPRVDIYDTSAGLEVLADLPGIEPENLKIKVEDGILTIEAKRVEGQSEPEDSYREFERVNYFRQFELSDEVDTERISADFTHGVLKLSLPRSERTRPRQIEVKVS